MMMLAQCQRNSPSSLAYLIKIQISKQTRKFPAYFRIPLMSLTPKPNDKSSRCKSFIINQEECDKLWVSVNFSFDINRGENKFT